MKIVWITLGVLGALVILGWVGLRIRPAPFAGLAARATAPETLPLPKGLPAPVDRFYRRVYGDRAPVITSAVISGRATMRPIRALPAFPSRFRFTHVAGHDYRHYIEITAFGLPLIKVNEHYLEGRGHMDLGPIGASEGPQIDQAANLGLWAESVWLPAVWLTDPRVRWQAVDNETAILTVPFVDAEQTMIARFDPQTGLLTAIEAMRYKDEDEPKKVLWICEMDGWVEIDGSLLPRNGSITWMDEGTPWAVFDVEEVVYNTDVETYIRARGP